jgi:hypothetical protein
MIKIFLFISLIVHIQETIWLLLVLIIIVIIRTVGINGRLIHITVIIVDTCLAT